MRAAAVLASAVVATALVPSVADASDRSLRQTLVGGIAEIRAEPRPERLEPKLERTLVRVRADRASTAAGGRARRLAIGGFASTLKGVRAQLALVREDSGNIEAATRHAREADRALDAGARRLRAAARLLGLSVGRLNGR